MKKKYLSILLLFNLISCQSSNYNLNMNYDFLECTNLENGKAYEKFITYVNRQNGNIDNLKLKKGINVLSEKEGYLKEINALEIGKLSCKLGSGRVKKEDNIDYDAGVILKKEVGSYVKKGDILCTIYGKKQESIDIDKIFKISKNKPKKKESLIIEII